MKQIEIGMLAKSLSGHDKGTIYVITDMQGEYLLLVDGRIRTLEKPKKKSNKHVQFIYNVPELIRDKRESKSWSNEEIKRAIKLYQAES